MQQYVLYFPIQHINFVSTLLKMFSFIFLTAVGVLCLQMIEDIVASTTAYKQYILRMQHTTVFFFKQ